MRLMVQVVSDLDLYERYRTRFNMLFLKNVLQIIEKRPYNYSTKHTNGAIVKNLASGIWISQ